MKFFFFYIFFVFSLPSFSQEKAKHGAASDTLQVDAACGQCQFGMKGTGCDLAVRFGGKSYYVDGTKMDDHGDAHASDGMCNAIRQAKISGKIDKGRFRATSFTLLPSDKK